MSNTNQSRRILRCTQTLRTLITIGGIAVFMAFSSTASAAVIVHTVAAPMASVGASCENNSPSGCNGNEFIPITGIPKFDASLGTLDSISFGLTGGTLQIDASIDEITTTGTPNSAIFSFDFLTGLLMPSPTYGQVLSASNGDNVMVECYGEESFPCSDYYSDYFTPYHFTTFTSSQDGDWIDFADFIGVGDISVIELGVITQSAAFSDLINMDTVEAWLDIGFYDSEDLATVTVEYDFTPVPVPAAAWLFGSTLVLLGWMRRRAG